MATPREIATACRAVVNAADEAERLNQDKTRLQTLAAAAQNELQAALNRFNTAVENLKTLVNT